MKHLIAAALVIGALALLPASAGAAPEHHCHAFRGPGDSLVHSTNFRVAGISCGKAKRVIFVGLQNQRHVYQAVRHNWRTHRTGRYGPLGYKQVWISGKQRRIWLSWID